MLKYDIDLSTEFRVFPEAGKIPTTFLGCSSRKNYIFEAIDFKVSKTLKASFEILVIFMGWLLINFFRWSS